MSVVAFDPGLDGGVVSLCGDAVHAMPMPIVGKEIDVAAVVAFLHQQEPRIVIVEKLGVRPKQSAQSGATSGTNYGVLLGIIQALGYPMHIVRPQEWKRIVLKGTAKDKVAAINHVRRAYPGIDLIPKPKRVPHDGIADAVCIAEWGVREKLTL